MWENFGFIVGTGMIKLEVRNAVVVSSKTTELVPIPFEDIAALVDELELPDEAAARLTLSACTLIQWYIMPKALFPGTERAISRERLTKIAEASGVLRSELAGLGALAAMTLTEAAQDLLGDNDPRFSLIGLQRQLAQLSHAAGRALNQLPAQNRGNRQDPASEIVVRQLVRVTQQGAVRAMSTGLCWTKRGRGSRASAHKGLPLGQGFRAHILVNFAADEVALGIEVVIE